MKMPFLFGIHCHQPVGNFSYVVDDAVERCYAPFMETALLFPKFRFAAHYSGWLLDYIRQNHKSVFKNMKKLADNNQIEFFTGGYYEPILSAIPPNDRRGQIEMLNKYIKKHFGQTPEGLWLTERVWDPSIIPDVVDVGVKNMIVDDYHFISAGYYKEMLNGYYLTEHDGFKVNLFPIDKKLRYLVPFKDEQDILDYIEESSEQGGKCSVIFDDGEKFGVWPSTYEWVYEKGWLERFLDTINSSEKVEFSFFKETAEKIKPSGLAYLPITSYSEMGEWSLFSSRIDQLETLRGSFETEELKEVGDAFVKGGIWKNFFAKYPESNRIHKRTLRLSQYARKYNDKALTEALYKSECNDALWHGIFGGLYLPNLRNNSWSFIIEAEKEYERLAGKGLKVEVEDLDYDGYLDAYVRMDGLNASFTSRDCGQMTSLEFKKNNLNLINTIARRKEAYHKVFFNEEDKATDTEASSQEGISTIHDFNVELTDEMKDMLVYDWYNKNSFVDHVVTEFDQKKFADCAFHELSDFTNSPADIKSGKSMLSFSRNGGIYLDGKHNSQIVKKYEFVDDGINFEIQLNTDCPCALVYVLEMNFHFWDMENISINSEKSGNINKGASFKITDGLSAKIEITFEQTQEVFSSIFSTVSQSEKGVDLTAQGVSLFIPISFSKKLNLKGRLEVN